MKAISLDSFVQSYKTLDENIWKKYFDLFGIKYDKLSELDDIATLTALLNQYQCTSLDNFFIGFTIKQISKEFDLLRFGQTEIINIEIKHSSTEEKIRTQLEQNRYYLSHFDKAIHTYTFIATTNEVYRMDENKILSISSIQELIKVLHKQVSLEIKNIDELFHPQNYLISPFNKTDEFLKGNYFLTEHQQNIKKNILSLCDKPENCSISIKGNPGTGKTLLLYDIAKTFYKKGKKILIIHCGQLNSGHYSLIKEGWNIIPIKDLNTRNVGNFNIILIDETQRIRPRQIEKIYQYCANSIDTKCIFSYDPRQCLSVRESNNNIGDLIEENYVKKCNQHKLTNKIRTNEELASFIKNLFDLTKIQSKQRELNPKYKNIEIQYFSDPNSVKVFSRNLQDKGWTVINHTPSIHYNVKYSEYQLNTAAVSHNVIGQDFERVVVYIDEHFYYRDSSLYSHGANGSPYSLNKMLYQNITRTVQQIFIIIVNNQNVLDKILNILK